MEDNIDSYFPLIRSIAKQFYNVDKEDLYQAGYLGLVKAYKNYTDTSVKFSTYAFKYIFGEMYDLTVKSRNIKLNKRCLNILKTVQRVTNELTQKNMREVTLADVSDYMGIDIHELEYIMMLTDETVCLDELEELISVPEEKEDLDDALSVLDPLSSKVIEFRYKSDMTQSEVAKTLGISQVKVSRIEAKSKQKIKEYISA